MNRLLKFKIILLLIAITAFIYQNKVLAQANCATELFPNQVTYLNETRNARNSIDISGDIYEVPLVAHILSNENLTNGLSKSNLLSAIHNLNQAFEAASFRFNLCNINYIINDDLNVIKYSRQGFSNEFTMAANTIQTSALNVYFVPDARGLDNQSVCGWSSYPADLKAFNKNWIVINNDCANNGSTLVHEVGHYFNLYHTHQGANTSLQIEDIELIDESNCGPNIGDELCDTPAEPYRKGMGLIGTVSEDCIFTCDYFDSNGQVYDPDNGFGFNYMSYAPPTCRVYFSPDQIKRMKISYLFDRNYLSNICPKGSSQSTAFKDSLYLMALYNATNGENWSPINWDLDVPVSAWQGVELDEQGLVTKIELPNNNIEGVLPIEIGNFQALETLILSDNRISGFLPLSLGNLKQLNILNLSHNYITGKIPAELGYLYQLYELKLNNNQLSQNIPPKLGNLENLTNLSLTDNNLSGCFNDNLTDLCDVESASISQGNNFNEDWFAFCSYEANRCECDRKVDSLALLNLYVATKGHSWQTKWNLTKSIDKWHGITLNDLGCVRKIELSNNQLLGELPQEIQNLQYLDTLIISNNTVCGKIPSTIGNISKLKVLDLSGNIISGSIPAEIGDLKKLETLRLNANQLCGYIPHEIGDLKKLTEIYLTDNLFTKCYHPKLIGLIDEENGVANDFYDLAINNPCTNCNIDDWTAMKALYTSIKANVSFTDEGVLSGTTPPNDCSLAKVENVYLNNYGRVETILWHNAGLSGYIPTNINLLEDLGSLDLGGNNLSGSIPSSLADLANLYYLRLSNNSDLQECFPSEMLCLCDQTNVFFSSDDYDSENSSQNFQSFCRNVSHNCEGNEADIIYPGDFNVDGIVNHLDLLNWTIAAGNEGPTRTNPTNEWMPQVCENWEGEANGINYKHQDANGDGYINEEDLEVLSLNYNKSNLAENVSQDELITNGPVYSLTLLPSYGIENTFDIYLNAKDPNINSVSLQGLAFVLDLADLPVEDIQFDFIDETKQPIVESIEKVNGTYQIAFGWETEIESPVNQPKTEEDPFGRAAVVITADSPIDGIYSLKINNGILLNGNDDLLSGEVTTLDHYFDNSVSIAGIDCQDQAVSGFFGTDQKLYAGAYIISPRQGNEITTIDACTTVEFKSGGYVELNPGFHAEFGSTFVAVNRECTEDTEPKYSKPDHLISHLNIFPNPTQSEGTLEYTLQNQSIINIGLTDITGKQIRQITNNMNKNKGTHQITFNVNELPTGVYYCTLKVNDFINTKKLIIVR